MPDTPNFNMQQQFPIASVIDAAQRNAALQQQARESGQQQLLQGMQTIGSVGQSLLQHRMAIAQALSQAQIFAQTPEGQQLTGNNQVATAGGRPVTNNQTAQGGVGQAPVPNQSPINQGVLAQAFLGQEPGAFLKNLFEQQKNSREAAYQKGELALGGQKVASMERLTRAALGLKGRGLSIEEQGNINKSITEAQAQQAALIKDLPSSIVASIRQGILPDKKYEAAYTQHQVLQKRINSLQAQLTGTPASSGDAAHLSTADLLAIVNQYSQ